MKTKICKTCKWWRYEPVFNRHFCYLPYFPEMSGNTEDAKNDSPSATQPNFGCIMWNGKGWGMFYGKFEEATCEKTLQ